MTTGPHIVVGREAQFVTTSVTVVVRVTPPPVPVIVSVKVPLRVFRAVLTVSVEVEVAGFGLNEAVVLFGSPLTLRLTALVNPPCGVIVTVYAVELPPPTVRLLGLAPIEKSEVAAAVTVRLTVVVCVAVVPVPVTVIEYVPAAVPAPTATDIVDEPPAVTEVGLKPAVVPDGRPLALRLTVCADPLVTAVEIVDVPLDPCPTVRLLGLAPIEKSEIEAVNAVSVTSSSRKYVGSNG